MSLVDNFKSFFQKSVNSGIFQFFAPTSMPKMGDKQYLQAYKGWVYACTAAIAERFADMDIKLQEVDKDGDWQDVDGHEATAALHYVNPFWSYNDLLIHAASMQELDGNEFWYVVTKGKAVDEIWPLDPSKVSVVKDPTNFIKGYVFRNEKGVDVPFEASEIIHFKRFNPTDQYRGMGTVAAAALPIDTNEYAAEWQRNFFGNSAMPSALLQSEGKLSQDQYDRIRANWDSKYKGVQNAHRMAILEGNLKFTPISPTARDMQFSEGRKDLRDEIMAIFRVPKTILGITEDVNLASAQATEYVFAKYVIKPKMKAFIETLNEYYLPLFGLDTTKYRLGFIDPVPENLDQQRLDRADGITHYYMTPNEARNQIGLDPIEGGDSLYVPSLYTPVGGQPETEDNPNEDNAENAEKRKKKLKKLFKKERKIKINVKKTAAKRNAYIAGQISSAHKIFVGLNEQLMSMLLENLKSKSGRTEFRKSRKTKAANDLVRLLFSNYKDWVGLIFNATKDGMTTVMEQSGKDALAEVGVDMTFDLQNPRALDYLNQHAMENATSYTDTMKEDIALEVQQGVEEGQSVDQIAGTLGEFFDGQSDYRAERLARTETIDAYAQGNLEGYRQSGVVTGKEWLFDGGDCTSGECPDNEDDGTIALDDNFSSGDDAPPAHPNCECALQPVTESDEASTEGD